ncbi:MAG: DUF4402 domain-containing protein [Bacteroidales bacterium]|nr:DUF4402 domain-containing protein [Bacteroidales bacterium]TFH50254.1 MAG: DUF4402 domain-containing protein [Bacteroidia bacterium]
MKRLRRIIFSLLCLLVLHGVRAFAQVSATGHISAEVISALSAIETSQMNFGRFSPGPQGGELILSPESTISVLGSVYSGSGVHNAAGFYVTGETGIAYSITLPSEPITITNTSSSRTMIVDNWSSIPATTPGAGMLQDGFQTVLVGATLKIGTLSDNPVGIYTGTYSITFDFY